MDLTTYLATRISQIDRCLDELVPPLSLPHHKLFEAARYSLLGSGKRIRPILVLAVCDMLGGDVKKALHPAAAIEMIHTYSLIHDDLPCMDNDDFRRGKPTLHRAFPESHALLAGDFLLTHAFFVLANAPEINSEVKVKLIQLLSEASGGNGMIGGQIQDIESSRHVLNKESMDQMHRAKTGALIEASVGFGAILGGASAKEYETLQRCARAVGLAFQIIDDVIDVTASEDKHGKKVSSDTVNGKQTYATLLGIETARSEAEKLHRFALEELSKLPHDIKLLQALVSYIITRHK